MLPMSREYCVSCEQTEWHATILIRTLDATQETPGRVNNVLIYRVISSAFERTIARRHRAAATREFKALAESVFVGSREREIAAWLFLHLHVIALPPSSSPRWVKRESHPRFWILVPNRTPELACGTFAAIRKIRHLEERLRIREMLENSSDRSSPVGVSRLYATRVDARIWIWIIKKTLRSSLTSV